MDLSYSLGIELQHREAMLRVQPSVAMTNALDMPHSVAKPKLVDDRADDIVETRTKPSTGDDAHLQVHRIKVDFSTRPRDLKTGEVLTRPEALLNPLEVALIEDPLVVVNKATRGQRRVDCTVSQRGDPMGVNVDILEGDGCLLFKKESLHLRSSNQYEEKSLECGSIRA